jgi:hypothetical protein
MNINHIHIPRSITIFFAVLITISFLNGTAHAFVSAKVSATSTPVVDASTLAATPLPVTVSPAPEPLESADTTGIIVLAILLLVILLFGVTWGSRLIMPRLPKPPRKQ